MSDNKPMISDEAVEAAAKEYYALPGEGVWTMTDAEFNQELAKAWDEGYTTGNAHNGRRDANPYRSQA